MNFIKTHLSENEEIYINGRVSEWLYIPTVILFSTICLIGLLGLIGVGPAEWVSICKNPFTVIGMIIIAGCATYHYYKYKCVEMAITNKRVVYKKGIFAHTTNELRLEKVEGVSVEQNIMGAIFNYGNIVFTGVGDTVVIFSDIKNPINAKKEIDTVLNKYKV